MRVLFFSQEHLHPCGHVEAEDKHRPIDKISNESQEIDSKHIRRSLKLLKRQFMNAQEYTFNNSAIENTIIFTKQVTHNIPLVVSSQSSLILKNTNEIDLSHVIFFHSLNSSQFRVR